MRPNDCEKITNSLVNVYGGLVHLPMFFKSIIVKVEERVQELKWIDAVKEKYKSI